MIELVLAPAFKPAFICPSVPVQEIKMKMTIKNICLMFNDFILPKNEKQPGFNVNWNSFIPLPGDNFY